VKGGREGWPIEPRFGRPHQLPSYFLRVPYRALKKSRSLEDLKKSRSLEVLKKSDT
jgi:hypothetical protein